MLDKSSDILNAGNICRRRAETANVSKPFPATEEANVSELRDSKSLDNKATEHPADNRLKAEDIGNLAFNAQGLIPVITQDAATRAVLMLAWADREALQLTLETGQAHYFSRSRGKIWRKGETSGHTQQVTDIRFDCDRDTLLYLAHQQGPACHTGSYSCFGVGSTPNTPSTDPLTALQATVADRLKHPKEGSYTNYLFDKGLDKILKKVGEETAEVIIAAKNTNTDELRYEAADLLYHLSVLLTERGLAWADVYAELKNREQN